MLLGDKICRLNIFMVIIIGKCIIKIIYVWYVCVGVVIMILKYFIYELCVIFKFIIN